MGCPGVGDQKNGGFVNCAGKNYMEGKGRDTSSLFLKNGQNRYLRGWKGKKSRGSFKETKGSLGMTMGREVFFWG